MRKFSVVLAASLSLCSGLATAASIPQNAAAQAPSSVTTLLAENGSSVTSCNRTAANDFSRQQNQDLFIKDDQAGGWGDEVNTMQQTKTVQNCSSNASWAERRTIDSANYWVSQKINYCHHYAPTWFPQSYYQTHEWCGNTENDTPTINYYPNATQGELTRWNYNGATRNQTSDYWETTGQWYGVDCSNFTALIYNWGFGKRFSSDVQVQGGQSQGSWDYPNDPSFTDQGVHDGYGPAGGPAGNMVCADGTTASLPTTSKSCDKHGGFISVFDAKGNYRPNQVTDQMLNNLKPGDLIYLATDHSRGKIYHVVMWTGQKVGGGAIQNSQLAPNQFCAQSDWYYPGNRGQWIIVDSTYQGPDYRIFSDCFYRSSIWGVRRVLNTNTTANAIAANASSMSVSASALPNNMNQ